LNANLFSLLKIKLPSLARPINSLHLPSFGHFQVFYKKNLSDFYDDFTSLHLTKSFVFDFGYIFILRPEKDICFPLLAPSLCNLKLYKSFPTLINSKLFYAPLLDIFNADPAILAVVPSFPY